MLFCTIITDPNGSVLSHKDVSTAALNQFGTTGNDTLKGIALFSNTIHGGDGDDVITGNSDSDHLYGDEGNDIIDGGYGADVLYGGSGDDTLGNSTQDIDGNSGSISSSPIFGNTYIGGTGDDEIYLSRYKDIIHYSLGDGNDTVFTTDLESDGVANRQDVLRFGDNIDSSNVSFDISGVDLLISIPGSDSISPGTILVKRWFTKGILLSANKIAYIEFQDGSVLSHKDVSALTLNNL